MRFSAAASSLERTLMLLMLALAGCASGEGEGEVTGTLTAVSCDLEGEFSLDPEFFSASAIEDQLEIRLQHTSAMPDVTDGLTIAVHDVPEVQAMLCAPIPIALTGAAALVQMTLVLAGTCPVSRGEGTPVLMAALDGEIVFDAIHSPEHPGEDKRIAGHFENVRFEDPGSPDETFAVLSGYFDFLYARGRPAQLFP
jgi:hypothetical protein